MCKNALIYIHGQYGKGEEISHYKPLFSDFDYYGFDYEATTPWEAKIEFIEYAKNIFKNHNKVYLIANSIGSYYSLFAFRDFSFEHIFFISPIANMKALIEYQMKESNVSIEELKAKSEIIAKDGSTLSYKYYIWATTEPFTISGKNKNIDIIFGDKDFLSTTTDARNLASSIGAKLHIINDCEHFFHTDYQFEKLDDIIENTLR